MLPRAPSFWQDMDSLWAKALSPLSCLYLAGHRVHQTFMTPYTSRLPVICIGNAIVGGSGKTPAVIALIHLLRETGMARHPVILTRGYGGSLKGPTYVDHEKHSYKDVGDEALLLACHAPVIVCADRGAGARLAELGEADILILDDGLQNNTLQKTLSLLVVDADYGFGNGKVLPAGPLREPLEDAMAKAAAVICVNGFMPLDKPQFESLIMAMPLEKRPFVAFAGIGQPEKFRRTLEQQGIDLAGWHAFADHHPYKEAELNKLLQESEKKGAQLITTEKDYIRLPESFQNKVRTLPIEMIFPGKDRLAAFLSEQLNASRHE